MEVCIRATRRLNSELIHRDLSRSIRDRALRPDFLSATGIRTRNDSRSKELITGLMSRLLAAVLCEPRVHYWVTAGETDGL